jgi:NagD protein
MTPATVAANYFAGRRMQRILVLGVEGVWRPIADAGLDVVRTARDAADGGLEVVTPGRDTADADPADAMADAIFIGWYRRIDMDEIEVACKAAWNGARLYCASMVPFFAARHGRALGSSRAVSAMITSVTGRRATPLGKPSRHVLRGAAKRIGCRPSELVVVGDDPALEVGMALDSGALAVAVHTGIAGAAEFAALAPDRRPHLSLPSIAHLKDYLAALCS